MCWDAHTHIHPHVRMRSLLEDQGTELLKYIRRSTSRDFKINVDQLKQQIGAESEDEEEEVEEAEGEWAHTRRLLLPMFNETHAY